jgi:hypothetical protein
MRQPAPSPLQTLLAAVPDEALRPLVLALLNGAAPAAANPGRRRWQPRQEGDFRNGRPLAGDRRQGGAPRRRAGWPKGKPRGPRKAIAKTGGIDPQQEENASLPGITSATAKEKRAARRQRQASSLRARRAAARQDKAGNGAHKGPAKGAHVPPPDGRTSPEVTPALALWEHAARLQPKTPWRAVAREFGTNEQQAVDCYLSKSNPPGLVTNAIERFLEMPVP